MKKLYLLFTMLVQVSIVFSQTHFIKGFVGNGYEQMNLNIVDAKISGVKLQADDEIAVFDGILCVGVLVLTQAVDSVNDAYIPSLTASAEELTNGVSDYAGFKEGNKIYLRFWDQSAGIEYHNIVLTFIDQTTGLPTTEKTFTKAATFFIAANAGNTGKTWTDLGSTSWTDPDSWDPAGVPEPKDNVTIPAGIPVPTFTATDIAYCGSLTFGSGVTMTFPSTASGTASLIVATDILGSPTVTFRRYLLANGWHMVSSPLSGQTVGGFLSVSPNSAGIPTKDVNSRGMMDYNETTNDWNPYFTNLTTDAISVGKGYSVRRDPSTGIIAFTGSLANGNVSVAVSKSNRGWNLIGNPVTSAMYVKQEVFGFLAQNDAVLDPSFKGIYLWDPTANAGSGAYTVVNKTEGQPNLSSGQGFFVKAASAGSVNFIKQMQVHQVDAPFKSATVK